MLFSRLCSQEERSLSSSLLFSPLLCSSLSTKENSWYPFQANFRKQELWLHLFLSPRELKKHVCPLKNWGLASGVKDGARDSELACLDYLFDLVISTLASCWVHFHYLHLSSYLLAWCLLHRKESQTGMTCGRGIIIWDPWVFLQVLCVLYCTEPGAVGRWIYL